MGCLDAGIRRHLLNYRFVAHVFLSVIHCMTIMNWCYSIVRSILYQKQLHGADQ